ncbi:hypothetical protein LOTGIDRAFT_190059 [Lottia gigantea]|uniref:Tectonin beta-propeller repeat-containing protein 1 n=1 Tax=Lottia gigantea TaxID=225164 RepID=V4BWK3_LOTGI|nr:hypothetical protein LOTGIDRAFT_190059 [Lottia gigantea]ESO93374.1 hypothetical protein LOTGIDRAFT_190059 [Lottia gigantea]
MTKQRLLLVNSSGDVFALNTEKKYFRELGKSTDGLKLKRVSAVEFGCWGIGHDQHVYVYIYSSDVPIRVAETTFENQRWSPWGGFTHKNLLPSDRKSWSNETGDKHMTRNDFPLPSEYWEWEGDWFIDENFKGEITDRGGWQYASDFPRQYSPEPKTFSMVRRRKWLRFRRYVAREKWAKISYSDKMEDGGTFIDVSVGGFQLPGQPAGFLSIWAVTVNGKVYVRENVCEECPEGTKWRLVSTDDTSVINISVGPTGLVWAVTWDGLVLVRLGVSRDNVYGSSWSEIPYPTNETRMMQVAVGNNTVWALSRDGIIWFRKGINGDNAWFNNQSAIGSCWIEMVGSLCHISVTPNDQASVFGIGLNDRKPYFRSGVNTSDLGGKTWQLLMLREDLSKLSHADSSFQSLDDEDTSSDYQSSVSLRGTPVSVSSITNSKDSKNNTMKSIKPLKATSLSKPDLSKSKTETKNTIKVSNQSECESTKSKNHKSMGIYNIDSMELKSTITMNPSTSNISETSDEVFTMCTITPAMPRYFWVWFSAMGCYIDEPTNVRWLQTRRGKFHSMYSFSLNQNITKRISPYIRNVILERLYQRNRTEIQQFQYLENAVDKSSWLKKSSMKWYRYGYRNRWEDVTVELEHSLQDNDSGIITIHYCPRGKPVNMQISFSDITCIKRIADPSAQSVFQIHTADTTCKNQPYLLMTSSESDTDEWLSTLLTANSHLWKIKQTIDKDSICSTTLRGDVFIHQPYKTYTKPYEMLWCQQGGHFKRIETCVNGITWAVGYDHTTWVYNQGYGGGLFRATSAMSKECYQQTDTRTISTYENQKWYPVIGYTNKGFLTDCYEWSDSTGIQDKNKESIKLPSSNWHWSGDWSVDFSGQVDQEGWQYSGNFNKPFHQQPGLRDGVRRRRWIRKCKLNTVGPWNKLGSTNIKDVTIQLDTISSTISPVIIWAVGSNGNVLCRLGVTIHNHQGDNWIDIPTDLPFTSVSIGGNNRAWGIAIDGSVYYRPGVTSTNPSGQCWLQVIPTPPQGSTLHLISVGETAVWAVDTKGNLWYREQITPTYPEGTRWCYVCNKVKHVSVGHNDEVWIVSLPNFGKFKHGTGMVYKRLGITTERPMGTGWDRVIGDGWQYVSIRGYIQKYIETEES